MNKPGYIIILTLMIIASAVALITVVVRESFRYQMQTRLAREKTYLRLLVFSSLECALSQLSLVLPKEEKPTKEEKPEAKGKEEESALQKWAMKVIPQLNRWQKIESSEIEGMVSYYLASEEGKFNLTDFDDVAEKSAEEKPAEGAEQQKAEKPTLLPAEAKVSPFTAFQELLKKEMNIRLKDALIQFKTQNQRMPEDVTELLKIPVFTPAKDRLFVTKEEGKKVLFLMDLLTVRPEKGKLNPWLLTKSAKRLLGITKEENPSKEVIKKLKPTTQWATEWDQLLAPVYGKKYQELEKGIAQLFSSEFEATAFSVVSYCTVGSSTQKIYALIELSEPGPEVSSKSVIFKISKLYWL